MLLVGLVVHIGAEWVGHLRQRVNRASLVVPFVIRSIRLERLLMCICLVHTFSKEFLSWLTWVETRLLEAIILRLEGHDFGLLTVHLIDTFNQF